MKNAKMQLAEENEETCPECGKEYEECSCEPDNDGTEGEEREEDASAGDAVYDMFCELTPAEQTRVLGMIKTKESSSRKRPMRADDEREFRPMEKE